MEFSFIEVGDCKFTSKEFHQRFFPVNFDISLWEFTSILKAITVLFLFHFDSCPAEPIIIWLTKQINTLSNQSFRGVLVKLFAQKNSEVLLENVSGEVMFKYRSNVFEAGLRHGLFPRIFPILEQPFCRAHVSISSWSLPSKHWTLIQRWYMLK